MQSLRSILILFIMTVSTYSQICTITPFNITNKSQPVCTLEESTPDDLPLSVYIIITLIIIFSYVFLIWWCSIITYILDYINILPKKPENTFQLFWFIYYIFYKPPTDIIQVVLTGWLIYFGSLFFTAIIHPKDSKTMFFYCYLYYRFFL